MSARLGLGLVLVSVAIALAVLGGCARAPGDGAGAGATETLEIVPRLDPSPTPSGSTLPLTCQVTDLPVYINEMDGFCFAYPDYFSLGDQPSDKPDVLGPPRGSEVEPVRATFSVDVAPAAEGETIRAQAEAFLADFTPVDPASLTWREVPVGGQQGLSVEPVPAQLSYRLVFVQRGGLVYRLSFWPVDVAEAQDDMTDLMQTTLGSFAFID